MSAPIYVVSKGRWESRHTVRRLDEMHAEYRVIVEQHEHDRYAAVIDPRRLLVLDPQYQTDYDCCDEHGLTKSTGPGPARNYAWDHAVEHGHRYHWVMDDNIWQFLRYQHGKRIPIQTPAMFGALEDFHDRFENLALSGPQYRMFMPDDQDRRPFTLNTRIYSCLLIRNDIPYRWRARYNEDTDLSLRVLKDGWCTVQYNAFLQNKLWTKAPTGRLADRTSGGNTTDFYLEEGTLPKTRMLVRLHPDVARIVWRFDRWHHHVDYRPFRVNHLRLKQGIEIPDTPNEYGMTLAQRRPIRSARIQQMYDNEHA